MEQFPTHNNPEKKKVPKAGLLGSGAIAAVGAGIAMNPDAAPTYEGGTERGEQSRYEEQASHKELEATKLPEGFTTDSEVVAQSPRAEDIRPKQRPEQWQAFESLDHPQLLLDHLVREQAVRLGVDPDTFMRQMDKLFTMFAAIESSMDPHAANPESSARGYYQYLTANNDPGEHNGSIHTAINRLHRIVNKEQFVDTTKPNDHSNMEWTHELYTNPESITEVPMENQSLLVLADLVAAEGTDEYLRALASDNPQEARKAALELYYQAHHTNPDESVVRNAERKVDDYFPVTEYLTAQL